MSDDLMFQDEIHELVRAAYGAITTGAGRPMARRFYSDEELGSVPADAVAWALGTGNPVRHAELAEGEVVLDIGSGGGMDTVLAARRVGPTGKVVGLDMLPEMVERARKTVQEAGVASWCELRAGEMEAIPLPDESVDVVISNGVINLSPRKSRAFAEITRVLRPGGRFCVSDLVVNDDLPPEVLTTGAAWAGCIAGALSEHVLVRKLDRAGLVDIEMSERSPLSVDDVALYPLFTPAVLSLMRRLLDDDTQQHIAASLIARARKPAARPHRPRVVGAATATSVQSVDDIGAATEAGGVTVRALKHVDDLELTVKDIEPGHTTPVHSHSHSHLGIIMSGTGLLQLTGRDPPLSPGDVFSIAPNEPHAIESQGPRKLRLVCLDCFVAPAP
ncbi:MAG: methyltransferase domain-containing protein [Acidimicrobiales bacterium]